MELSGSCFCGRCGWASDTEPNWVGICHCDSCRRNCAAPFTTFFGIDNNHWQWTGRTPRTHKSTTGVTRYFCDDCGTPMAYHNVKWNHEVHFYVASMDDQELLPPQFHVHWQERVSWISMDDDLPKYAGSADGQDPM